ncbi:MAG: PKD domain-containing protein, partial [Bacteroidota bacterium]
GEEFNGFSITGGVVYDQENWPEAYRGKYLMADYNAKWFKSVTLDGNQEIQAIDHFGKAPYFVTGLAVSPSDGCLYYAAYAPRVCRICYGGNVAPQARITADTLYGPSPLRVSFAADSSFDPNGDPLTFQWDLGDGNWINGPEASYTFESSGPGPEAFTVTLRAIDAEGASGQSSQIISLNNTPPQVNIHSIDAGYRYPLDEVSILELDALVIDQEHADTDLVYQWQTILHHNDHTHPEGLDNRPQTEARITPVGCGTEQYFYRIRLEVTDAHGLTGVDERYLYPDCPEFVRWGGLEAQSSQAGVTLLWETELEINSRRFEVQRSVNGGSIWISVGYVEGADFSVLPLSYSWQDRAPYAGEALYRVRLIEASGQASLSSEIKVNWEAPQELSLYPNPLKDEAKVVLGVIEAVAEFNVSDLSGRSLYRQRWDENDHFAQDLDLGFLPIGVYIYTIKNGDKQIQGKLIKE